MSFSQNQSYNVGFDLEFVQSPLLLEIILLLSLFSPARIGHNIGKQHTEYLWRTSVIRAIRKSNELPPTRLLPLGLLRDCVLTFEDGSQDSMHSNIIAASSMDLSLVVRRVAKCKALRGFTLLKSRDSHVVT